MFFGPVLELVYVKVLETLAERIESSNLSWSIFLKVANFEKKVNFLGLLYGAVRSAHI